MSVAIVDCGGANLRSVATSIERLQIPYVITDNSDEIMKAQHVILPGVGSAQNVMKHLESKNLNNVITQLRQPVLGICIGMQILFNYSAEGNTKCLGIFDENIDRFSESNLLKVPQMGWNKVEFSDAKLKKLNDYYYFANSFYAKTFNSTKAMSDYGSAFSSVVQKDNFLGCQFHPEKSAEAGVRFLKYFLTKS